MLKNRQPETVFLGGKPEGSSEMVRSDNILYYNHLPSAAMKEVLTHSENIIARAGYSTIMDLICLGKSALLIPTPGQTEQEYLAEYLSGKGWFSCIFQRDITKDLKFCEASPPGWNEDLSEQSRLLFDRALNELLKD